MIDVIGYEGLYAVTRLGSVWSYRSQRLLRPVKNNRGYLSVRLFASGHAKSMLVHRLVATAYTYRPDGKDEVNHIDGVKTNNSASNLEWCDRRYNVRHAVRAGLLLGKRQALGVRGSAHPSAKLSEEDVVTIRKLYDDGTTMTALAAEYSVSPSLVSGIINRTHWKHV